MMCTESDVTIYNSLSITDLTKLLNKKIASMYTDEFQFGRARVPPSVPKEFRDIIAEVYVLSEILKNKVEESEESNCLQYTKHLIM